MKDTIKIGVDIFIYDDFFDERPDKTFVELNHSIVQRILKHIKVVKELNVYKISEFDYRPEFYTLNDNEILVEMEDFRVDAVILEVLDSSCFWGGSIKSTNIGWETDQIGTETLTELDTVWNTEKSRLPLLTGTLKAKEAQELLQERLKEL